MFFQDSEYSTSWSEEKVVWMIMARSKPLGRVRLLAIHEPESAKPWLIPDDKVRKPSWKAGKHPRSVRGAQHNRP